jgi:hypothetical protein
MFNALAEDGDRDVNNRGGGAVYVSLGHYGLERDGHGSRVPAEIRICYQRMLSLILLVVRGFRLFNNPNK